MAIMLSGIFGSQQSKSPFWEASPNVQIYGVFNGSFDQFVVGSWQSTRRVLVAQNRNYVRKRLYFPNHGLCFLVNLVILFSMWFPSSAYHWFLLGHHKSSTAILNQCVILCLSETNKQNTYSKGVGSLKKHLPVKLNIKLTKAAVNK